MANVPGPGLTRVLREDGPLPVARCVAIAAAVARGMAEAHRHGIVHRDLKPANILLDRKGEPVVTDFGLALRTAPTPDAIRAAPPDGDPRLTHAGVLMGTPAYMPPEQARGELDRMGPASDVYALGAILYELLTGRPPFPPCPLGEMVRRIEMEPPPVPSRVRREVPPGLDAVCRRAMAKGPADRYASMDAFAEALAPFAAQRRPRRWGRVAVAAAALALLLVIAGAVFYVRTDYGTIEVQLNDPPADIQVSVDGKDIRVTDKGRVTTVRAGKHGLDVKGPGFETVSQQFTVMRGEKKVLEITLPKPVATVKPTPPEGPKQEDSNPEKIKPGGPSSGAAKPSPVALSPEQSRLAQLLHRGNELIQRGAYGDLGTVAAEALTIDPESPGALAIRATVRAARGDGDGARADVEAALKLNPETPQALLVRSHLSRQAGKRDETIADATAAIRIDPTFTPAWSNRAAAYLDRGDYHQVIADCTWVITTLWSKRPDINAYVNRAAAYGCLGEYDKALADYETAQEVAPSDPRIWAQRSALYVKMGKAREAAADWDKAKGLDPTLRLEARATFPDPPQPPERKKLSPEDRDAFALSLDAAKNAVAEDSFTDARKAVDDAIRIDPTSAEAHAVRAWLLVKTKQGSEGLKEANEAIRLDPNIAAAYASRGAARFLLNDQGGAIADLTISLRLDSKLAVAWNGRGSAYRRRGQYRQGAADLSEAITLEPDIAVHFTNRGENYLFLGEYRKALADYKRAAELQKTNGRWLLICAAIRTRLNDTDGAAKDKEHAIKLDPQLQYAQPIELPEPLPQAKTDPE
jgi:tetratricopeptide (TPR) repeat protein